MLIIRNRYFLSDYIFAGVSDETHKQMEIVIHKTRKLRGLSRCLQKIRRYMIVKGMKLSCDSLYREGMIEEIKKKAKRHNVLLLFDIQNLKEIIIIRRLLPSHKIIVFLWNPAKCFCRNVFSKKDYKGSIRREGIEVHTFDQNDVAEYGFHLVDQPYRLPKTNLKFAVPNKDVFFVGQEKHRSKCILHAKRLFEEAGLEFTCYVRRDKHSKEIKELSGLYHNEQLEYGDTLNLISQHKAYLEILQEGQSGMTLRPLEALFMNRKLITNNALMRESHLYHPSRIFILTPETTAKEIVDFLNTPFCPLDDQTINRHEINHWLSQFDKPVNNK